MTIRREIEQKVKELIDAAEKKGIYFSDNLIAAIKRTYLINLRRKRTGYIDENGVNEVNNMLSGTDCYLDYGCHSHCYAVVHRTYGTLYDGSVIGLGGK